MTIVPPEMPQFDEFGRPIQKYPVVNTGAMPVAQAQMPAPVAQAPAAQAPVAQMPAPIADQFAPVQLPTVPPNPAQQGITALTPPNREDPQYRNGKFRTIMNAVAGGLAGAANPAAGVQVGSALHDMKYNRAMQDYKTKLGSLQAQDVAYQEPVAQGEKEATLGIQRGSGQALGAYRSVEAGAAQDRARVAQEESDRKKDADKVKASRSKMLNQLTQHQIDNPKVDDLQYIASLEPEDQPDAIKLLQQMHEAKQSSLDLIEAQHKAAAKGTIAGGGTPGALGQVEAKAEAQARGQSRGAEEGKPEIDESTLNALVSKAKVDPGSAESEVKLLPDKQKRQVLAAMGASGDVLQHLSTREQDRLYSSYITRNHTANVRELLKDPQIVQNLGPVAGRLEIIKGRIGTGGQQEPDQLDTSKVDMSKMSPTGQQKMGEFLNYLTYMIAWESTNLSAGTRPAWQLVKMLQATGPRASMAPDRIEGSLKAVDRSIQSTIDGILHPGQIRTSSRPVTAPSSGGMKIDWDKVK